MSHEIRTPLNGIVGTIDLLNHQPLSKEQQGLVDTAIHSARLLQGIIDDILDFSKIEAEKLILESVPFNIHDIISETASNLKAQLSKSNIDLIFYINPEIPELNGDPVRIKQILFNLLGNAIKFSKNLPDRNGRIVLSIDKDYDESDKLQLLIHVIDNGIGIDQETQKKLFKPFIQGESDTVRRFGGTGLGLVITSRLVEAMKGTIKVTSEKDQGTDFSLTIPFTSSNKNIFEAENEFKGKTFLICSNDLDISNLVDKYLSFSGATVIKSTLENLSGKLSNMDINHIRPVILLDSNDNLDNANEIISRFHKDFNEDLKFIFLTRHQSLQPGGLNLLSINALLFKDFNLKIKSIINNNPIGSSADNHLPSPQKSDGVYDSNLPSISANILLVEDNDINQKVLSSQLQSLGYKCDVALNGVEALKIFNTGHYDLILTDCHMPKMDGYELTWTIRQQENNARQIPIIAITADALKGTKDKCLKYGMNDYLTKPIDLDNLKTILSKWLNHHSTKDDNIVNLTKETKSDENNDIVNINTLSDLLGIDDNDSLAEYYNDFATSSKKIVAEIRSLNPEHQGNDISGCAHKLKSASRTIGAMMLANTCLALEVAGKEMDQKAINSNLQDLYSNFDDVLEWINDFQSFQDERNSC